jgi:tetratricopeptide (TPR) repeat protein
VIETALATNDRQVAGDHLRRYVELVRGRIAGLNRAAEYALRLGWQQEAFDLASRARDVGFSEATQRILGLIHLQRGEVDKAAFHLERADPTAAVLEGLIRAHLAMGNVQAADREARRAALIPQMPEDLKQARARTQALVARRDEYLKQMGETGKKRTGSIDYLVCAEELRTQRRPIARVEAMLALADDNNGSVRAMKGLLSLERGHLREALAHAEKAIGASPWDARGWYVRGRVRLERLALGGLADLEKAASLSKEKDAEILAALAEAQRAAGQEDAARETLRKASQLSRPLAKE